MGRLAKLLEDRKITVVLEPSARDWLADKGWDPAYGARPLKRALQRLVENPLALRLLEGDFGEGDTVRVDAKDGELVFEQAGARAAAAV
jgi:ATP-dependent Clp protease ATP-binding subunit ClpB